MARLGRRYPVKPHYNTVPDKYLYIDTSAVNTGDYYGRHDLPTSTTGAATTMSTQWYLPFDAMNRSFIQFTLPSLAKGKIRKISLFMFSNGGSSLGLPLNCHQLTRTFNETNGTWNNYDTGLPWTTAGGDYNPAVVCSVIDTGLGWKEFVLQGAGSINAIASLTWGSSVGVVIKAATESGPTCNQGWYSKENTELRPYIAITYDPTTINRTSTLVDDGNVWSDVPASNPKTAYGVYEIQALDSYGSLRHCYLRFTLPATLGTITKIDLKLVTNTPQTSVNQELHQANNGTWNGTTMTWNSDNANINATVISTGSNPAAAFSEYRLNIMGGNAVNPLSTLTWGQTVNLVIKNNPENHSGWTGLQAYGMGSNIEDYKKPQLEITYIPFSANKNSSNSAKVAIKRSFFY